MKEHSIELRQKPNKTSNLKKLNKSKVNLFGDHI